MAWITTPTLMDLPPASDRATGFGMNCSLAMAASTARTFVSRTRAVPFRMRETVLGETPASFATISRVTVEPFEAAVTRRSSSDRRILRLAWSCPGSAAPRAPFERPVWSAGSAAPQQK